MADTQRENKNKGGNAPQGGAGSTAGGGAGAGGGMTGGGAMTGTMSNLADQARDAASSVAQAAKGAMSDPAGAVEGATSGVASGMRSLAGTLRENAPDQGMLGSTASGVAQGLESGARYLQQEGFEGMTEDVSGMIRRNPIPAALICLGVGFLIGQMMSSSSSRSY